MCCAQEIAYTQCTWSCVHPVLYNIASTTDNLTGEIAKEVYLELTLVGCLNI